MGTEEEMNDYDEFIANKRKVRRARGIKPTFLPDCLKPFQRFLCEWALLKGRAALFEGCGLGKSLQSLVCAENAVRQHNRPVLILAPLAVSRQFVEEGKKFDVPCKQTQDGTVYKGINVTNYERIENYNPEDFCMVVMDEESCIKNADGKLRRKVTDFVQRVPYRLAGTATPAPNDYMELGTASEALGYMPYRQMLAMFFVNGEDSVQQWVLKGHAKIRFWQWVATWARALRTPSDLGFSDDGYILPPLNVTHHTIPSGRRGSGLLPYVAKTLDEQRVERIRTLKQRCELAAELLPKDKQGIVWCHLNPESELLTKLIPGAVEVHGRDKDKDKERKLIGFTEGKYRVMVTKPRIAGFGLNWQHCSEMVYFPSWSHEQYYQTIRRCWRFGQLLQVNCRIVASEAESTVVSGMLRKERQSDQMYSSIVRHMNEALRESERRDGSLQMGIPLWL